MSEKKIVFIEDCDDYEKGQEYPVTMITGDEEDHLLWVEFSIDEDTTDFYYFRKADNMAYMGENNDIPFAKLVESN